MSQTTTSSAPSGDVIDLEGLKGWAAEMQQGMTGLAEFLDSLGPGLEAEGVNGRPIALVHQIKEQAQAIAQIDQAQMAKAIADLEQQRQAHEAVEHSGDMDYAMG